METYAECKMPCEIPLHVTERNRGPVKTKITVIANTFELYYTTLQYMATEGLQ